MLWLWCSRWGMGQVASTRASPRSAILRERSPCTSLPYRVTFARRDAPFESPNPRRLATTTLSAAEIDAPTWAPAGDKLAFSSKRPGDSQNQIYRMGVGDTVPTRLHPQSYVQRHPDWSPRGDWVAYDQELSTPKVWVYNTQTSQAVQLSQGSNHDLMPVFEPHGQALAYVRSASGFHLRRMNLDASGDTQVLANLCSTLPRSLRWTPDADSLCFACNDSLFKVPQQGERAFTSISA